MKRLVEVEVENCRTLNLGDVLCPHLIESEAFCYCTCKKQNSRPKGQEKKMNDNHEQIRARGKVVLAEGSTGEIINRF